MPLLRADFCQSQMSCLARLAKVTLRFTAFGLLDFAHSCLQSDKQRNRQTNKLHWNHDLLGRDYKGYKTLFSAWSELCGRVTSHTDFQLHFSGTVELLEEHVGVREQSRAFTVLFFPQCNLLMLYSINVDEFHTYIFAEPVPVCWVERLSYPCFNLYFCYCLWFRLYLLLFSFPSEELQEAEHLREEAESSGSPPPAAPRAQIPFSACMNALSEPETLTDFWSSAVQGKTTATKSVTFYTFFLSSWTLFT